jgi:hypothetical protein
MLSISDLCNPEVEDSTSLSIHSMSSFSDIPPVNYGNKPNSKVIKRRTRYTIQERFAIINELKQRNCTMRTIAIAHNTTVRNVARWKALYNLHSSRCAPVVTSSGSNQSDQKWLRFDILLVQYYLSTFTRLCMFTDNIQALIELYIEILQEH